MKKFEIYLAGGCKHEEDEGMGWRDLVTQQYDDIYGIKIINPLKYFSYSTKRHQSDRHVKQYYFSRIKKCDCVLVNLNNSEKSCGTCQEVQYAVDNDIPVIGFGKDNVYSWLLIDCQCVFDSAEEAMDYIIKYYLE